MDSGSEESLVCRDGGPTPTLSVSTPADTLSRPASYRGCPGLYFFPELTHYGCLSLLITTRLTLGEETALLFICHLKNTENPKNDTLLGLPWWLSSEEFACQCRRHRFDPWVATILWSRKWQPTPVFLPGESHGERSLVGYIVYGVAKESDTT